MAGSQVHGIGFAHRAHHVHEKICFKPEQLDPVKSLSARTAPTIDGLERDRNQENDANFCSRDRYHGWRRDELGRFGT